MLPNPGRALMRLVNIIKSAALNYGAERRVLLLHGPVGSAKSTIVRLLKKGLEVYSQTDAGILYTFSWLIPDLHGQDSLEPCPMHEEPLKLVPPPLREKVATAGISGPGRFCSDADNCTSIRGTVTEPRTLTCVSHVPLASQKICVGL